MGTKYKPTKTNNMTTTDVIMLSIVIIASAICGAIFIKIMRRLTDES